MYLAEDSFAEVRRRLAEVDHDLVLGGQGVELDAMTPSSFIVEGLSLEELQFAIPLIILVFY